MNWIRRHKLLSIIILVIIIAVAAAAGSSGKKSDNSTNTAQTAKTYRFDDRADKQVKDVELLPKETGSVKGMKLTVTKAQYATQMGEFDKAKAGKTFLVTSVTIENTSDKTQPYNEFDFRVQTAGGQVLDPTVISSQTSPLNSGDLVTGGKVSGQIVFEVPKESGHQYLIWKPGLESDRAIIQTQ